ncbi:MAG: cytochrome c oxidase subunit II [Woeseiaceae bacterium]
MSASKIAKKLGSLLLTALLLGPAMAFAEYSTLNMTESVSNVGQQMYDLHMLVLWICVVAGVLVFGVIIWSIIFHRKSKGAKPAHFHENTTIEVVWTSIPLIILVAIAVPATKTLLEYEDTTNSDITIKATGWQWKWEYDYIDDKVASGKGIHFFSALSKASNEARQLGANIAFPEHYLLDVDKRIVVPVGKKIRVLTTSNDVIHSWWVPELAIKRDAIPGFINESWFQAEKEGVYRGQCAELCGKDHGFMPIVVEVKSVEDYKKWASAEKGMAAKAAAAANAASGKTYTKAELMAKGKDVYTANCAACHQASGAGGGPFPALKGSKVATTGAIADHMAIIQNGKGIMPPFGSQLSALDIAAVTTYERNAWGNDTGDVVQPSQVK